MQLQLREDSDSISSVRYLLHHIFRTLVDKLGVLGLHIEETFDLEERVKNNAAYLQDYICDHSTDIMKAKCTQCSKRSNRTNALHLPNTSAVYLFREDPAVQEQTLRDVTVLVQIIMGGMEGCCRAIQTVDHTAKMLLRQTIPSSSSPSPNGILAFRFAQMPVVKDHVGALVSLFQFSVDCGGYFLENHGDRHFFCQGGSRHSTSSFLIARNDRTLLQAEDVLEYSSSEVKRCRTESEGELEERLTCSAEVSKYIVTIATPFSLLEPKILAQVLKPVMASFMVPSSSTCSSKGNYFFTAVIEMLLLSFSPAVSLVALETVLSIVINSVSEYGGSMSWMFAESATQHGQHTFEDKSTLRKLFSSALQSLQRFVGNEFALAPNLKVMIHQLLRVASLLPLRDLRNSNCLHFLQLLFRVLNLKTLSASLLAFRPLFSTVLQCLSEILTRTDSNLDLKMRRQVLGLICSIPVDIDSLSPHLPVMLHYILSALCLKGQVVGDLYREALVMLESCADVLSLDTITIALASKPGIAEGLFSQLSRHLKPKPYPLGDIACRIMGKLGSCHAFFHTSHCQNQNIDYKLSGNVDVIQVTINSRLFCPDSKPNASCGLIQLGMDNLIINACKVLESSMQLSNNSGPISSIVDEIAIIALKKEGNNSLCQEENDNKIQTQSKRKSIKSHNSFSSTKRKGLVEKRDRDTLEGPSCKRNIDLSKPCLDVMSVQEENRTIVERFQNESRSAAFCVVEDGLCGLTHSIRQKDNLNDSGEIISCKQLLSHRSLFSRTLFTIFSMLNDPCLARRALILIRDVYSLLTIPFGEHPLKSPLIEGTVDAVYDVIFRSLQSHQTIDQDTDFKNCSSYRPLVEWLRTISISTLMEIKGNDSKMEVMSDADSDDIIIDEDERNQGLSYAINIEDPFISRLTSRCFLTCRSEYLDERLSAVRALHALSALLSRAWLISTVNTIVKNILSALEFQTSLFSLCRVEETLQTLRYIVKSVFSDPQSAPSIVESDEKSISNPIKIEGSKIDKTVNSEDLNKKEEVEKEEVSVELLHVLVSALFHLSPLVQVGARETLKEICVALRQDMSSVLLPVKDYVTTMMEEKLFISCNNEGRCGGLNQSSFSGIMFCLSMGPSFAMTNMFLINALSTVLDVSEAEEALCQSSSPLESVDTLSFLILTTLDYQTCENEYHKGSLIDSPIKLDQSLIDMKIRSPSVNLNPTMIRRLLFTSLVRALCINVKTSSATIVLAPENKDVLQRSFSLLFKSLSSPSAQISICSHKSLQLLIALKTGDSPCITEKDYEALFPG